MGNIAILINGDRGKNYPSQADIKENGDVPFVNAGHLNGIDIDFTEMNYISREKYNSLSSGKFQYGDILYCLRGSLGKKAKVNTTISGAVASSLVIIRPNPERVNCDYLMFALDSPSIREQLIKANNGSSQPNLSAASVRQYCIELPRLELQNNIVQKLTKLRSIITHRKQQLLKLDELVKARFVEMFDDIEDRGTIAEICSIITDGTHQPPKFVENGIPFLFVSNIVTNEITYNAEKFISEETYNELYKRTPIEIGDIVLSTVGSYGHPAVVKSNKRFLFQRHIAYLKPISSVVNSVYLHSAILSNDVQRQIDERVKGIAQKTLNLSEIRKVIVPIPSLETQEQFAAFVEQTDKSKVAVQKALDEAQMLFDSLMQEYFG